jgi:hypothetical protein
MMRAGQIGVHPPGALGVAYFVHARADCFLGRGGGGITEALKQAGALRLDEHGTLRLIPLRGRIFSNLLEAEAGQCVPELVMVCCEPDQLTEFTGHVTRYLENLAERSRLNSIDDVRTRVPILLILPNGVLYELTLRAFEEQVREARVLGRLPSVTDEMAAALFGRVVRGISLQAGGRRGDGAQAVYVLENKGRLVFAGGGAAERGRVEEILAAHDYPFTHVRDAPGTRIEFDKAMISIVLNVGGLIHTVRPDGELIDLRMGDLCRDATKADFIEQITRAVFRVGQAAGAYPPDAEYEQVWAVFRSIILADADHITSSLKRFRDALDRGLAGVRLFSNEEWLLTPLERYAARAGFSDDEQLFRTLRQQVQESMARAIRRRHNEPPGLSRRSSGRISAMRLAAQRDFSIELYDAGPDDMVLVGTMLDDEHLLKLEVHVFLPDEQIIRSRLEVIRAPFPVCTEIEAAAERLVGLRIERGVLNEIARRVGGRGGCSHVKELATNIMHFAASHLIWRRSGMDRSDPSYARKPPEERFALTRGLLRDSCLAYCQTTPLGLDERVGIRRVGEEHRSPLPLGEYEPSLGVVLRERSARWADRVYLRHRQKAPGMLARGFAPVTLTWSEFNIRTRRIAQNLINLGVRPGDLLCMLSENRAEMYLFEMAAMSIGAVSVPVFAGYGPPQVAYVLGHARPRFVVVSGIHQLEKIERERHPWVERYYCMDFDADTERWGALNFAALLAEGGVSDATFDERIDAVRPDDLCMVMYTSGTTGPPKGVQLCHGNLISQQKALSLIWDVSERDVLMNYLPWHHSFGGLFERFLSLYHGAELCLDDSRGRDLERLLENWRLYRPTIFCSVPRVHALLTAMCHERPDVAEMVFGDRLRFVFTAGAPLPVAVEAAYREQNIPVPGG